MAISVYLDSIDNEQLLISAQHVFNQLQDQLSSFNIYLDPVGDVASLQHIFNQLQDQLSAQTTPISVYLDPVGDDASSLQHVFNQLQDQLDATS